MIAIGKLKVLIAFSILAIIELLLLVSMLFGVSEYNLLPFLAILGPTIGLFIGLFVSGDISQSNYKEVANYINLNKLGKGK